MFGPVETLDKNGKPNHHVNQDIVKALRGLIEKASISPAGFAADITADEAAALRELGDAPTKFDPLA